jgi:hypothetical protein
LSSAFLTGPAACRTRHPNQAHADITAKAINFIATKESVFFVNALRFLRALRTSPHGNIHDAETNRG